MHMALKIGQPFFQVHIDPMDGTCVMAEYRVRTIRGGKVTAIQYMPGITWVKLSTKSGDYGWDKSIAPVFRKTWPETDSCEDQGLFTTRSKAWRAAQKRMKGERFRSWFEDGMAEKADRTIKRMLAQAKG